MSTCIPRAQNIGIFVFRKDNYLIFLNLSCFFFVQPQPGDGSARRVDRRGSPPRDSRAGNLHHGVGQGLRRV